MLPTRPLILVGCAGWNLPASVRDRFPTEGTHLHRYAQRLPVVEINSSFYRFHLRRTYQRWAESVPTHFRFSVKMPRRMTHELRLADCERELHDFLGTVAGLGEKMGCLLVQLPPSLRYEPRLINDFLSSLRAATDVPTVIEPRHISWFTEAVSAIFIEHHVGRVVADPLPKIAVAEPAGWLETIYFRLHGSPLIYYSNYSLEFLRTLINKLETALHESQVCWCIFDNTAAGAAWQNALDLRMLQTSTSLSRAFVSGFSRTRRDGRANRLQVKVQTKRITPWD